MKNEFIYAARILTSLGKLREPMTPGELGAGVDGNRAIATTLCLLLETGYVSRNGDGRYSIACDPEQVNLLELKEIFGPYAWSEKQYLADIIDESLREITIARIIESDRPKLPTRHDIEMLEDCIRRIELKTGKKFPKSKLDPANEMEELVEMTV